MAHAACRLVWRAGCYYLEVLVVDLHASTFVAVALQTDHVGAACKHFCGRGPPNPRALSCTDLVPLEKEVEESRVAARCGEVRALDRAGPRCHGSFNETEV